MNTTNNTNPETSYRILIVEDNQIHIDWAKKCLSEHQLTFAESENEFYSLITKESDRYCSEYDSIKKDGKTVHVELTFKDYDFVITDLNLPVDRGESTSPEIGKGIFELLLKFTFEKEHLKGCAIVSRIDSHRTIGSRIKTALVNWQRWKGEPYQFIRDLFDEEKCTTSPEKVKATLDIEGSKKFSEMERRAIVACSVSSRSCTDVISPSGEILQNIDYPEAYKLVGLGWKFLKPYKEILEALIRNQNQVS